MNLTIVEKAEIFVTKLFEEKLRPEFLFHNLAHTRSVVQNAEEIGYGMSLPVEKVEILLLAAWFHDSGNVIEHKGHEAHSVEIARNFLTENKYPEEKTGLICDLIESTRLSENREGLLYDIIRDADLLHTGQKGYQEKIANYREELRVLCEKSFTDDEWNRFNLEFIREHPFRTTYTQQNYNERREKNMAKIEKKVKKEAKPAKEPKEIKEPKEAKEPKQTPEIKEKPASESRKSELRKAGEERRKQAAEAIIAEEKQKKYARGVETVFRVTSRNHMDLSNIADGKANILISVNAIIISILVSTIVGKLMAYSFLVVPTIILLTICLFSLAFAILSTRPKVTTGRVSPDDIKNHRGNLLFFGNFYNMELPEYQEGMNELINNNDYLYGSMIRDVYFLGKVLERKYRFLRISYDIFLSGIIVAVIAYIIAILKNA